MVVLTSGRTLIEVTCLRETAGGAPNKFRRAVDYLSKDSPDPISVVFKDDGVWACCDEQETLKTTQKRPFLNVRPVATSTIKERISSRQYVLSLALSRLPLGSTWKKRFSRISAYEFCKYLHLRKPEEQERFFCKTGLYNDLSLYTDVHFSAPQQRRNITNPSHKISILPSDTIIFLGFSGGFCSKTSLEHNLKGLECKKKLLVLDASPFLDPISCGRRERAKTAEVLRLFLALDVQFEIAHLSARSRVAHELGIDSENIRPFRRYIGLSVEGATKRPTLIGISACDSSSPVRFALSVGSFKNRRNVTLLLAAWAEALQQTPDIPLLVLASQDGLSIDGTDRLINTQGFLVRDFWRERPFSICVCEAPDDDELRWLYKNASFVVQPPSSSGLGIATSEAHAFGKICLDEDALKIWAQIDETKPTASASIDDWARLIGSIATKTRHNTATGD